MHEIFRCPVCGEPLTESEKLYHCAKNHSFDKAKSGYVNLLPIKQKHAKLPGDNPEMVRARRDFLNQGYYQHLQETLCEAVKQYMPSGGVLLDAGCGEGYYTKKIADTLPENCICAGIDISKTAADLAARADKKTKYAVGSVFHLPVGENQISVLVSVFAPYCHAEFLRVLKSGAFLIMVIPSAKHLWELKTAVYDKPYENQVKAYQLENFIFKQKIITEKEIDISSPEDIQNLFQMTPYAYRTSPHEKERLAKLKTLSVRTAFEILIYQKEA